MKWRVEVTNLGGTETFWQAFRPVGTLAWERIAWGHASTPVDAFAKGINAIQACPEVVGAE